MNLNGRGLFGTIIIHVLILVLLILGGLTFPDPPPEEEGIMVNFGTDDTGFGFIEPKGDDSNAGNPEPFIAEAVPEVFEESIPDDPTPPDPVYEEVVVEEAVVEDNTQDIEETPIKEDPKPTAEEIRKQQEEVERIKKEKEDARIKKETEDRIARETAERIRQEKEAERIRLAEEARIAQEKADISKRGENAFGNPGVGTEAGSEGINPGTGDNQGVPTGIQGAPNYGDGKGLGDGGDSYGLEGRVARSTGTPNVDNCEVTSKIEVTVEIQVDRQGNVVSASRGRADYSDQCIWTACIAAAKKTKFNIDSNAAYQQKGWIKYTIQP